MASIPVVDLRAHNAGSLFARQLCEHGFVSLVHHGIPIGLLRKAYAVSRELFSYSDSDLAPYRHDAYPHTLGRSGFFPYGSEKAKDHVGGWDLKRFWHVYCPQSVHPVNVFPDNLVPKFRSVMAGMFTELNLLSFQLLHAIQNYSGAMLPVSFADTLQGSPSLLRVIHYPVMSSWPPDALRSSAHEDINLITLLVAADASGLEIRTKSGAWIPIDNPPDAIIVNTGDMLEMATFGDMPSMTHRVCNPDSDTSRFSMPFFVHPRPKTPLVTVGQYLSRITRLGDSSISLKVMKELQRHNVVQTLLLLENAFDNPLVTAEQYLETRLREVGAYGT